MNLILNGEQRDLTAIGTVSDLLKELGLAAAGVLVEQNGQVVPRSQFTATNLAEGDRIEIIKVVAGG
jgi:sulfur carrier protein